MKKIIPALFLFISSISLAFSQSPAGSFSIKGTVIDSVSKKPVEFATVSFKNPSGQVIKTMLTKTDGSFVFEKLPEGKYAATIIHVGYTNKIITVNTAGSGRQTDLGTIALNGQTKQLNAVTITTDRPLIKQEVDRISYDLQADPESKVNSVLDMMRKVPMLTLDAEDNIQLKGNTNYKILINGKPSSMVERNPKDILRSMPAASVQRIEVITTPPAKYDADGLAGIINIITNKKVDNGYNGSINANGRFPVGGPGTGESFNFKQGKFGVSAFGGGSLYNTPSTSLESTRISSIGSQSSVLAQNTVRKSDSKSAYLGTEISYELDSLSLISGQLNINGNRSTGESGQVSELNGSSGPLQRYQLDNLNKGKGNGFDAALNYQLGFKKSKNRLLTFSYRYYAFGNDQNSKLAVSNQVNYLNPDYRQINESNADEQTIQIDYVHPVKKLSVEAGLKGIIRNNKSDFKYLAMQSSGEFEPVADRTNTFNNRQNVYAAYNTYQYSLKSWGFKAGVRVENTVIDADFVSNASQVKQNYFNVVPSVSINRNFKNMSSLNLGFSQRIQRPGINQLNPFVDRSNPNFETTGNPGLRPTTGSSLQLGYNWLKKVTISYNISYNRINGLIFPVSVLDPVTNITRTRFENVGKAQVLGNNVNVYYPFSTTWNMSLNANLFYGQAEGLSNGVPIKNHGLLYNMNFSSTRSFQKGLRLSMGVNVNGGNLTIQERSNGFVSSSFTVTKDVIKDKLSFSASTSNPFSKYRTNHTHTFGPNYDQNSYSQLYFRSGNISMNYRFGKLKETIKKNKRGISNDDVAN